MSDDLLDHIERVARLVYDMRTERRRISKTVRNRVGDRDGWICRICEGHVDRDLPWLRGPRPDPAGPVLNDRYPSVEHVVPVSMGGTNDEANLAICHLGCNVRQQHGLKPAVNYDLIRVATAASDVLNAVAQVRDGGLDPQRPDVLPAWKVELLVKFLKGSGLGDQVPDEVRAYLRDSRRRALSFEHAEAPAGTGA